MSNIKNDFESDRVQLLSWRKDGLADILSPYNPEFVDAVAEFNPSDNDKVVKLVFDYGDVIINKGKLNIPFEDGRCLPIDHPDVSEKLRDMLDYSAIPTLVLLNKSSEVFLRKSKQCIPLNLFEPGGILGIFETLDALFDMPSMTDWSVSAGVRSIFMLPKITETKRFRRLGEEYKIPLSLQPRTLHDHWALFVQIAKNAKVENPWRSEVIFIPKSWIEKLKLQKNSCLQQFLYKEGWKQCKFAVGRTSINHTWQILTDTLASRNAKPALQITDQLKHLLLMAYGYFPGFRPCLDDEIACPSKLIKKALIEYYRIKEYLPTLIHVYPDSTLANGKPVYYSLSFPSLLEGSPIPKNGTTLMLNQKLIKYLLETLEDRLPKNSKLYQDIFEKYRFDYFHVEQDKASLIQGSDTLPVVDKEFGIDSFQYPDRIFCSTGMFLRGLFCLTKK